MNLGLTAVVIGVLFVLLKLGMHYKETQTPDFKDGALAGISALAGLYAMDMYHQKVSKSVEVFTDKPSF
jgi:hypothetical protein